MRLASQLPDPFTAEAVNLGPLYVDRLFESILALEGKKGLSSLPRKEQVALYLDYMQRSAAKRPRRRTRFIPFYTAFFLQQHLEATVGQAVKPESLLEIAGMYRFYLREKPAAAFEESRYYALWQMGALLERTGGAWPEAEHWLLEATRLDPLRGEAAGRLTRHYMGVEEWQNAYIFSSYAAAHYFGNDPSASRRWFVDPEQYGWQVLARHAEACQQAGKVREAETTYQKLIQYAALHHEGLLAEDITAIWQLGERFPKAGAWPLAAV